MGWNSKIFAASALALWAAIVAAVGVKFGTTDAAAAFLLMGLAASHGFGLRVQPLGGSLFSSNSSSKTSSNTTANTTSTYDTTDQRVGVDGTGNIGAGPGASVTVNTTETDVSDVIATAALAAASDTAEYALDSNAHVSDAAAKLASDALDDNADAVRAATGTANNAVNSIATVAGQAVDSVSKTFTDLAAGQVDLLADVVKSNSDTTTATESAYAQFAQQTVQAAVDGISDAHTDPTQASVTAFAQYGAYAVVAVAIAIGLFALRPRKA